MNTPSQPAERQRLDEIAQEYRAGGYQVTLEPDQTRLPEALADFRPDLLAVSPQENVVVEVTTRLGLVANGKARCALAAAVAALPGWRFELAVVGREEVPPEPLRDAEELSPKEIRHRAGAVRLLVKENFEAAVLVAWSLAEAAMRVAARTCGIPAAGGSALLLTKELYAAGVIDRSDFDWLKETLQGRNLLAHGYAWSKTEGSRVGKLLDLTEQMLRPDPAAA